MFLNGGKFVLNLDRLRNNVLHVTYACSRASIPALKREHISSDARDVILDIVSDKYNEKLFNKLKSHDEQRLISTFVRTTKIPNIEFSEFDRAFQDHFDILHGQITAGNTNIAIKQEYKQYVMRGISEGLIPRNHGMNLIITNL